MKNLYNPFELLKLIRDRVVTNRKDLQRVSYPLCWDLDEVLLKSFQELGWVEVGKDGGIEPTKLLFKVQRALDASLTRLSAYGRDSIVTNPVFGNPRNPNTHVDLFVLMPFDSILAPVYEDHIQKVSEELELKSLRADDFFSTNSIISDIWNAIASAKILIADCTSRNPNVFYEIGIAHTLGKPVVLIAQSTEDIPFDIKHIRTIVYDFTPRGMQKFEATLKDTLKKELEVPRTLEELIIAEKEDKKPIH